MKELENKTFVSEEIITNEYDYMYGDKKNEKVDFSFINVVTEKEITKHAIFTYRQALALARERRNDRRYRNYEYIINNI